MPDRKPGEAQKFGLPPRPFLYTLDQIAGLLALTERQVREGYVHFNGHTPGIHKKDTLLANNIAPVGAPLDWRVSEGELIRFLKAKRFKVIETAYTLGRM